MKRLIFSTLLVACGIALADPSFDCTKAKEDAELAICDSKKLSVIDKVFSDNYRSIINSDIGVTAKKSIKQEQREWVKKRNACMSNECITKAYISRNDEICDTPVLSGAHPGCQSLTTNDTVQDNQESSKTSTQNAISTKKQCYDQYVGLQLILYGIDKCSGMPTDLKILAELSYNGKCEGVLTPNEMASAKSSKEFKKGVEEAKNKAKTSPFTYKYNCKF